MVTDFLKKSYYANFERCCGIKLPKDILFSFLEIYDRAAFQKIIITSTELFLCHNDAVL